MVKYCYAYGCTNRFSKNSISFHKFPLKDKTLFRKWVVATNREYFQPIFNSYLCGEHFLPSDVDFTKDEDKPHLLPNAAPSIFTFPKKVRKKDRKKMKDFTVISVNTAASEIEIAIANLIPL